MFGKQSVYDFIVGWRTEKHFATVAVGEIEQDARGIECVPAVALLVGEEWLLRLTTVVVGV